MMFLKRPLKRRDCKDTKKVSIRKSFGFIF